MDPSLVRAGRSDLVPEEWGGESYGLGPEPTPPLSFPSVNVTGVEFYDCEVSIFAKDLLDAFDGELKKRRSRHKQKQRTESFHQQVEEMEAQSEEASAFATGYGTSGEFPEDLKELLDIEESNDEDAPTDADGDEVLVTPLPKSSKPRNRWPGSSDQDKTRAMVRDIHEQGRGIAITCRLSDEVVDAARSSKKGLPSHLLERLTKLLKQRFKQPVDIVIVLEQGLGEGPHLHGVVDVADTQENRHLVREALTVLGACPQIGLMERQVHVSDLYEPDGWGRYPFKWRSTSKSNLKVDRTMAASKNLRKRGEANYNSFKRKAAENRG